MVAYPRLYRGKPRAKLVGRKCASFRMPRSTNARLKWLTEATGLTMTQVASAIIHCAAQDWRGPRRGQLVEAISREATSGLNGNTTFSDEHSFQTSMNLTLIAIEEINEIQRESGLHRDRALAAMVDELVLGFGEVDGPGGTEPGDVNPA